MKNITYLIELTVVSLLIVISICFFNRIFKYTDTGGGGGFENFYAEKSGSIDVMFFGSSHVHCTVNNAKLWDDAGIASFTLSAGAQSIDSTYYYIREALKYQKPEVIFVETYMVPKLTENPDGYYGYDMTNIYRTDLPMNFSFSYFEMVLEQNRIYNFGFEKTAEFITKLPIVHARYDELDSSRENKYFFKRGYIGSFEQQASERYPITEERAEISDASKEYLGKIVKLCSDNGVDLIFFCSPYPQPEEECAKQNYISDYVKSLGCDFIDFNRLYDDIGLDYSVDIRDGDHVNNSGSSKVTDYLENYILENYDLIDHRGDDDYHLWDLDSRYLSDRYDLNELKNCSDIVSYILKLEEIKDKYIIIISLDGQYNILGESAYSEALSDLGIDRESYICGGSYVIANGNMLYSSGVDETYVYSTKVGNGTILVSRAKPNSQVEDEYDKMNTNDQLCINGINYAQVVNGINIVVYDSELNLVVDSVGTNVYLGLNVDRAIPIDF